MIIKFVMDLFEIRVVTVGSIPQNILFGAENFLIWPTVVKKNDFVF